jgi:hypothetical protein
MEGFRRETERSDVLTDIAILIGPFYLRYMREWLRIKNSS